MKYCLPYQKLLKYMAEVDEIIVPFSSEDLTFIKNLTRQEKVINNCVIIDIQSLEEALDIELFTGLKKDYPHINFKMSFLHYREEHEGLYEELRKNEIPFFFSTRVESWDIFHGLMDVGVSDIYIVGELGFELDKIGPQAHARQVSIRCFANICQSSWYHGDMLKSFFIRPEDVHIYEPYVDVLEFFGGGNQQEVMYRVYSKEKKWFGKLNEIIIGLQSEIDSRFILPFFGKMRVKCGKRCLKGGSRCSICEGLEKTSNTLKEEGILFKFKTHD